jgi:hypothetical protein
MQRTFEPAISSGRGAAGPGAAVAQAWSAWQKKKRLGAARRPGLVRPGRVGGMGRIFCYY